METFLEYNTEIKYNKSVLIVPNYTHFGIDKNINADSFVLVLKSYLDNTNNKDTQFILPYPDGHIPSDFYRYDNVKLINMGKISTFPQTMRVGFPYNFFKSLLSEYEFDDIWCHLPEWLNDLLIVRRYSKTRQRIYGYCHWFELPENGCYNHNCFQNNIQGILKMETCGVNSEWVKKIVLERAGEIYNDKIIDRLNEIITPMYLGCDPFVDKKNVIKKTILFNHRNDYYTGADWFFNEMDSLYDTRKDFTVYTTISDTQRPYVKCIKHNDRQIYLDNIGRSDIGVGCFTKYSAWSMSTTDGLSRNVPYILPNGLCYPEMVGKDYPLLYNGKKQFVDILTNYLDGKIIRHNTENIVKRLSWSNTLQDWNIKKKKETKYEPPYDINDVMVEQKQ